VNGAAPTRAALLERLRAAGGRRTAFRAVLLDVMADIAPRHLPVQDIHGRLLDAGFPCDLSGVYRALGALADAGLVHPVATPRSTTYGLVDPPHHHAVCERCEAVFPVADPADVDVTEVLAPGHGFRPRRDGITVYGSCDDCRDGTP
jgi:Fur family transcriptional regulator, ferric uptake regulator